MLDDNYMEISLGEWQLRTAKTATQANASFKAPFWRPIMGRWLTWAGCAFLAAVRRLARVAKLDEDGQELVAKFCGLVEVAAT
jgi:hypothetical protein